MGKLHVSVVSGILAKRSKQINKRVKSGNPNAI
jgi:hypothetical protein